MVECGVGIDSAGGADGVGADGSIDEAIIEFVVCVCVSFVLVVVVIAVVVVVFFIDKSISLMWNLRLSLRKILVGCSRMEFLVLFHLK